MFCFKCGTRVADDAIFCLNCGNRIVPEQPVVEEAVVQPVPVMETVENVVVEEPAAAPIIEEPAIASATSESFENVQPAPSQNMYQQPVQNMYQPPVQQPVYNQSQYVQQGTFQQAPSQQLYQQPVQNMQNTYQPGYNQQAYTQSYYNAPVQKAKKEKVSVAAVIFLIVAAIAAVAVSIDQFIKGEIGMGIMNIFYCLTSIVLIVYSVSSKKTGSILKGVFFAIMLVLNIIFAGVSAFGAAIDIFGKATVGTDYYYAIILLLQFVFLYVYMIVSMIRGFMGKKNASYAACLLGYLGILLIVAAFVIDVVTDIQGLFAFKFIPVDMGLVCLIIGDLFATLRKGKNAAEAENN